MKRILFTPLVVLLAALVAFTTGCGHAEAASADSTSATLATWTAPGSLYCSLGCTGLAAWANTDRVPDARLQDALFVLSAYVPELGPVLEQDARQGVRIVVGRPEDPRAGADYDVSQRRITVRPEEAAGDIGALASLLAHELVHGTQDHTRAGHGCRDEIEAYTWQALVWERLRRSSAYPGLDEMVRAWHQGSLPQLVASWPLYRDVCSNQ